MGNFVTFSMPTVDTGQVCKEKYDLSEILGINKKFLIYGRFESLKKLLQKLRVYRPSVGFNWKRHYIQDLDRQLLTVNICVKNPTEEQVALILDSGEDIVKIKTPENYMNF